MNCALNEDGSLKDARDIPFYNSPSDARPMSFDSYVAARAGTESPSPSICAHPLMNVSETENTLEQFNITVKSSKRARGDGDTQVTQRNGKRARSQVSKPRKLKTASKNLTEMSRAADVVTLHSRTAKRPSKTRLGGSNKRGDDRGGALEEDVNVDDGVVTEEDGENEVDDSGSSGGRGSNVKAVSDIMTFATRTEDRRFQCDVCM